MLFFSILYVLFWKDMKTGGIEVIAEELSVLGKCSSALPFHIHDFHQVDLKCLFSLLFSFLFAFSLVMNWNQ